MWALLRRFSAESLARSGATKANSVGCEQCWPRAFRPAFYHHCAHRGVEWGPTHRRAPFTDGAKPSVGARHTIAAERRGEWIGHTECAVRVDEAGIGEADEWREWSNASEAVDLVGIGQRVIQSGAAASDGVMPDAISEPETRRKLEIDAIGASGGPSGVARIDKSGWGVGIAP